MKGLETRTAPTASVVLTEVKNLISTNGATSVVAVSSSLLRFGSFELLGR